MRVKIDSPPIFVVGCGHSGTSVLLAILGAHPRIYAVPYESYCAVGKSMEPFQEARYKFDRLAIEAGKNRWAEKTPKHILEIEKILHWLPNAKIVLIIRDGRDVAYSIQNRTGSLEDGIRRWREDNNAARKYWHNPNVHIIKYEKLVSDFETAITAALSFLDEEYFPGMKDYYKTEKRWYSSEISKPDTPVGKNHTQYRNWQINQPLFDGRERWKGLSEEELAFINQFAGDMLIELGYIKKRSASGALKEETGSQKIMPE